MNIRMLAYLALALIPLAPVRADVTVAKIFSDNMVLQRGRSVPVWGWGDAPGEKVKVSYQGREAAGVVDDRGCWEARLPAMDAVKKGGVLEVRAGNRVTFANVVVGDVYLVSGQSNAEFEMRRDYSFAAARAEASRFQNVRSVKFRHAVSPVPSQGDPPCGTWVVDDAEHVGAVSAVGYHMARELNARTGVPVGLLDDSWSGMRIEPFVCQEGLEQTPGLGGMARDALRVRTRALEYARQVVEAEKTGRFRLEGGLPDKGAWGMIHNAMVEPVTRFPIAAVVWYQGCHNAREGLRYLPKLEALIRGWRAKWNRELPFYVVQLAGFQAKNGDPAGADGFACIREAQRRVLERLPNVGLVTTFDIGNATDIHPRNKLDVGRRLARWALRDLFGAKDVVAGPLFSGFRQEGRQIKISFSHVGSGLAVARKDPNSPALEFEPDDHPKGFAVAGADRRWHWAEATIEKDGTVVVSSSAVERPVAVRYAYRSNPMGEANLYNREGLPATPFRSDDWD